MNLLIAFLLFATLCGLFTRSLDWRGYASFFGVGLLITGILLVDAGAW
jgi:hypothetical protein